MSEEEDACEVIGGEGRDGNIYIYTEITIGNKRYTTTHIADSSFFKQDLLSAHLPEGLRALAEEIGDYAFYRSNSLMHIYNYATTPATSFSDIIFSSRTPV